MRGFPLSPTPAKDRFVKRQVEGDGEVEISDINEIDDVMDLIQQAFDEQEQ